MSGQLPHPIASYFAAFNTHAVDAMAAPFAETATVKDEGQERTGVAAIREWIEETNRQYNPTVEVIDAAENGGQTIVTGRVSGTFPGSPADLRYVFTLDHEKISRLEIHP
jgi:hypothetical protein